MTEEWIEHAYPLRQVTIKLQGTKHSSREAIIDLLDAVLLRLKNGESYGYAHDDDYGYIFEYVDSVPNGPSFFDAPSGEK